MSTFDDIIKKIDENNIKIVHFVFISPYGELLCKSVLSIEIKRTLHISLEDGISVNGNLIKGYMDNNKWYRIVPDLDTFIVLPIAGNTTYREACFMCSNVNTTFDSRLLLKKVFVEYEKSGLYPMCGIGMAYGIPNTSEHEGNGIYRLIPGSSISSFNNILIDSLLKSDIDVESFMAYGPTHNGVEFVPQNILKCVDQLIISRWITKSLGLQMNIQVDNSYPFEGACPLHMSVWNDEHNSNLFFDPDGSMEYSKIAWNFVGGILANINEIFAIMDATTNCSRSLKLKKTFSNIDSDSVLGTPEFFVEKEKKSRVGWSKRCIFRGIPSDTNIYMALSCIYLAGLDGIKKELAPNGFIEPDREISAMDIDDKINCLQTNELFKNFFGEEIIKNLCNFLNKQEG